MPKLTCSLKYFLFAYHREIVGLVTLGHFELITDEIKKEYLDWCLTDEGKEYLVGGKFYEPVK